MKNNTKCQYFNARNTFTHEKLLYEKFKQDINRKPQNNERFKYRIRISNEMVF